MNSVILQPSGNKDAREHFVDTIENEVSIQRIKSHISEKDFRELKSIYPNGSCRVWGVTPGGSNITKWNRIEKGDVTLFSKSGVIYASGVTTYKLHSKSLASDLWNFNRKGQTWEYIYFLDEIKNHNIPYREFNIVAGYAENNVIQGFNVLSQDKSREILRAFDLESEIFVPEFQINQYENLVKKLESLKESEHEISSTRRLEQGYLKRLLFGNKTIGKCACCHKEFPISFLITAHIKKRAFCSIEERLDKNIVMPMCKFGCDEVFEKGYITVFDGIFKVVRNKHTSKALNHYLEEISGNSCEYYNAKTEDYFKWHYDHFK